MNELPVGVSKARLSSWSHEDGRNTLARRNAPYPDTRFKAGVRTFPELAMVKPGMEGVADSEAALRFCKNKWTGRFFMAIGANDPDPQMMQTLRSQIQGCPEPLVVANAGHFVPEWGEPVARAALHAFGDLS